MANVCCSNCGKAVEKLFQLYDDWNQPYFCSAVCESAFQELEYTTVDKQRKPNLPDNVLASSWGPTPKKEVSCKMMTFQEVIQEAKEQFEKSSGGTVSWRYGLEAFKRAAKMENNSLKEVKDYIEKFRASSGNPLSMARVMTKMTDKYFKDTVETMLLGRSAAEGLAAYEARFEDAWYKKEGGSSVYMAVLERDTKSLLCHSDDWLPF